MLTILKSIVEFCLSLLLCSVLGYGAMILLMGYAMSFDEPLAPTTIQEPEPIPPAPAHGKPAPTKPVVVVYTDAGCQPCQQLKHDIADSELANQFDFQYQAPVAGIRLVPTTIYNGRQYVGYRDYQSYSKWLTGNN